MRETVKLLEIIDKHIGKGESEETTEIDFIQPKKIVGELVGKLINVEILDKEK